MRDPRTVICGAVALLGMVCATVLYALGKMDGAAAVGGLAGTALGYVVGLHSDPHADAPTADAVEADA